MSLTQRFYATSVGSKPCLHGSARCLAACLLLAILWSPTAALAEGTEGGGLVVVVVFDELPLSSLLVEPRKIDADRYPAFAALAKVSTWYPATATVATRMLDAVPAILTGIRPGLERLSPINASHPNNLFSLLQPTHVLNVVETHTLVRAEPGAVPVDEEGKPKGSDPQVAKIFEIRRDSNRKLDQVEVTRAFIAGIPWHHERSGAERGSLHFLHIMLPTSPWRFMPSGLLYQPDRMFGSMGQMWSEEPWWPEDAYRRHLLQLQLTDRLLGELIDQLERSGLYDDALLVVTASFGVGFWASESRLEADRTEHPEDILGVPLFVKRPKQKAGSVDERVAETIDILPTLAELLDVELAWPVDGCSLVDAGCPERTVLTSIGYGGQRHLVHFEPSILGRSDTIRRKGALMGSGADQSKMYRFGPHAGLAGKAVSELTLGSGEVGAVKHADRRRGKKQSARKLGPRFVARLKLDAEPVGTPQVAIAIDGRIESIVPVPLDHRGRRRITAMLPEDSVAEKDAKLEVYLVTGEPGSAVLTRLRR